MNTEVKKCSGCGEFKPLSDFGRSKKHKDGLMYYCKNPCVKKYNAAYRAGNEEYIRYRKGTPEALARQRELYSSPEKLIKERERNKKESRRRMFRDSMYRRLYGLSLEQFESKFRRQGGACAICLKQNLDGKPLVVDHDHKTNIVRGLLCHQCNVAIGYAKDDLKIISAMFDYLETWGRMTAVRK